MFTFFLFFFLYNTIIFTFSSFLWEHLSNIPTLFYPLQVTAKFKCVVQVIDVYPWRVEDFHSPLGTCRIRLTLEDPTARIHAYVYAEDGVIHQV